MNKLYLCIPLFCSTLIACVSQGELPATQDPRTANSNQANLVKKADKNNSIGYLQDEMAICIGEVNSGEIAKSIDGKILVLNPANPSTRFLFASPNKLTSNEAVLLSKFKRESQRCRQITKNI
ncbi:hypothetical protein, partial [Polynucleobacter sp. 39-46-10]|uniref:hypothetical protein n=1 Tax=Polynucleobacter sp. 39-46-10 TaxID=1970428 RepID=UPI000BD47F76